MNMERRVIQRFQTFRFGKATPRSQVDFGLKVPPGCDFRRMSRTGFPPNLRNHP